MRQWNPCFTPRWGGSVFGNVPAPLTHLPHVPGLLGCPFPRCLACCLSSPLPPRVSSLPNALFLMHLHNHFVWFVCNHFVPHPPPPHDLPCLCFILLPFFLSFPPPFSLSSNLKAWQSPLIHLILAKPHIVPLNPVYREMRIVDVKDLLKDRVCVYNLQVLMLTGSENSTHKLWYCW